MILQWFIWTYADMVHAALASILALTVWKRRIAPLMRNRLAQRQQTPDRSAKP